MPLQLKPVEPARGFRWLGDAFRLFARRPLAFTMLFSAFLLVAFVFALVPVLGNVLPLMLAPLLSLGFMVACQSALLDGPVHPRQFIEPLQADPVRRKTLLLLSVAYGVGALLVLWLSELAAGGAMQKLQTVMADAKASPAQVTAALSDPGLTYSALTGLLLGSLLSAPFWHAPALIHWGGQSLGQALFSSTLAVWRSKGAFFCYGLAWVAVFVGFGSISALLLGVLNLGSLAATLAMPAGLLFSTVFYVSLLFIFNDSFGGAESRAAA